jgi:cation transport regulator ChaB
MQVKDSRLKSTYTRRGGSNREETTHKVAWNAVKKESKKDMDAGF